MDTRKLASDTSETLLRDEVRARGFKVRTGIQAGKKAKRKTTRKKAAKRKTKR